MSAAQPQVCAGQHRRRTEHRAQPQIPGGVQRIEATDHGHQPKNQHHSGQRERRADMPGDQGAQNLAELAADLSRKGPMVLIAGESCGTAVPLPVLTPDRPETDAICLIQTFYGMVLDIAIRRGMNIDRPNHLQKVTRTR